MIFGASILFPRWVSTTLISKSFELIWGPHVKEIFSGAWYSLGNRGDLSGVDNIVHVPIPNPK